MHKKRIFSMFAVFLLIVSVFQVRAYAVGRSASDTAIAWCQEQGIASGYADGSFHESDAISAKAFETMFARAFGDYYHKKTSALATGVLNRYQAAMLITEFTDAVHVSADGYDRSAAAKEIKDYTSIPSAYQNSVANTYALGIMRGLSDGKFHGENNITRGQAAVILYRVYHISDELPFAVMPVLTNGKEITEDNVFELLAELKSAYPCNKDFKGYESLDTKNKQVDNSIMSIVESYTVTGTEDDLCSTDTGCGGWAAFVCDYIFGQDASFRKTDLEHARPGDLMLKLDSTGKLAHVQIYVGPVRGFRANQSVRITNANNGLGTPTIAGSTAYKINWTNGVTSGSKFDVYTAYPD